MLSVLHILHCLLKGILDNFSCNLNKEALSDFFIILPEMLLDDPKLVVYFVICLNYCLCAA